MKNKTKSILTIIAILFLIVTSIYLVCLNHEIEKEIERQEKRSLYYLKIYYQEKCLKSETEKPED